MKIRVNTLIFMFNSVKNQSRLLRHVQGNLQYIIPSLVHTFISRV